MQYLVFLMNSHATEAFTQPEQGPEKILYMYFHYAIELLSKVYHTSDMSRILAKEK